MEMKKFNYMLEIDILRNSLQKNVGALRPEVCFLRVWVSKGHPDTLLAKTMAAANKHYLPLFSVLATRASGCHLNTHTLKNPP